MNDVLDDLSKLMDFINSCSMSDDEKQQAINLCSYIHAGIVDKNRLAQLESEDKDWGGEQADDLKAWMKALQDNSSKGY